MAKILITGSSSGIGKKAALELLNHNHEIIAVSRNNPNEFRNNSSYYHYNTDLNNLEESQIIFKKITKEHPDINIVILNAGIGIFKEIDRISNHEIISLMNINITSQMLLINILMPNLRNSENTKILMIGSESAINGAKKATIYSASKFAMRGFALSLQKELSNANIQVNLINPGAINTEFYDKIDFTHGDSNANYIETNQIVELLCFIIKQKNNFYFEEINLKQTKRVFKKK